MLRFERPGYLYMLLLIPVMILASFFVIYLQKKSLWRFTDPEFVKVLMPLKSVSRSWIKLILLLLAVSALVLGLANLQSGARMEEVKREGIDLFIAIDVSNSMMAEDIAPNRLERSKQAISRLIDKLEGDRIGIIVFAGKAYIQLPITTDYAAARLFLSTINTEIVSSQGTAIGEAIEIAMKSFDQNERNKAIVIISDGEDHEENAADLAADAAKAGINVFTIGMGLAEGAPIPVYNEYGKKTGFRKDRQGNTVVTKLNETILQSIAQSGNGSYVRANNTRSGLETIFNEINKLEKSEIDSKIFTDYEDRFQWFIAIAIFFLVVELFTTARKRNWESKINLWKK
ncbi:MAG: VWA domain-containing protein [Bacteroidales bacterium]|nr:VWA domain-containing protein [Bacteroidales bacterium]